VSKVYENYLELQQFNYDQRDEEVMKPIYDVHKLNCMNYSVDNGEEHYYLQCGWQSLYRFSKRHNVRFKTLCTALLDKGYYVLEDNKTQIEMI